MSAITGIYRLDGQPIDSSVLSRMTGALAGRGPDGCDTRLAGPVGLGHCMLFTTPESLNEHLPLTSGDGTLMITADARIDNREELSIALDLHKGEGSVPDSSLILQSYERWGDSCVDHLLGDFAFAIWDANKHQLFCARDHMGVRPFYYYGTGEFFAFGSEIKPLFHIPNVPREINEEYIVHYLASICENRQITSYKHIYRLPAANTLTVTRTGIHLHCYWHLDPTREIRYASNDEYERAFREIFTDAVRCRLRSAYPVGLLLSGGLDSSSVVSVARDILKQEKNPIRIIPSSSAIHTLSAVFDDVPEADERNFINAVLSKSEFSAHFLHPDRDSPLLKVNGHHWLKDDLPDDKNLFISWQLYQHAQNLGIRTIIDGFLGDDTISYCGGCLAELTRKGKWHTVFRESFGISRHWGIPIWKILLQQVIFRLMPSCMLSRWQILRNHPKEYLQDLPLINPDLAQRYNLAKSLWYREEQQWLLKTARELHHFALAWPAHQYDLENLDAAAATFGLDLRHPFSDHRLIEFCLALPPEQKVRGGYTRAILRYGLASSLPNEVQARAGKTDLGLVFLHCMRAVEGRNLEEILFKEPRLKEYIDIDLLRKTYNQFMDGNNVHAAFLWRAAVLALWLHRETFISEVE
jgi:asparagine synthase (glutamine-hydrolysing)